MAGSIEKRCPLIRLIASGIPPQRRSLFAPHLSVSKVRIIVYALACMVMPDADIHAKYDPGRGVRKERPVTPSARGKETESPFACLLCLRTKYFVPSSKRPSRSQHVGRGYYLDREALPSQCSALACRQPTSRPSIVTLGREPQDWDHPSAHSPTHISPPRLRTSSLYPVPCNSMPFPFPL